MVKLKPVEVELKWPCAKMPTTSAVMVPAFVIVPPELLKMAERAPSMRPVAVFVICTCPAGS